MQITKIIFLCLLTINSIKTIPGTAPLGEKSDYTGNISVPPRDNHREDDLMVYSRYGNVDKVKLILETSPTISILKHGESAIKNACRELYICRPNKEFDFWNEYSLMLTSSDYKKQEIIITMIENKLKEVNDIKSKLFDAINANNYNAVKELSKKISMGVTDRNGNNCLHGAAIKNNFKIFQFICSINPKLILEKNYSGLTPLDINPEMILHLYLQKSINLKALN